MIRLALISSAETAEAYGSISTRLHRAAWTAFAPLDSGGSGQALGQVTEATSAEELFTNQADAFDAVVIAADQATAGRLAKAASSLGKPVLAGAAGGDLAALGQATSLLMPAHPWRFLPSIQSVKRSLDAGKLGQASCCAFTVGCLPERPPVRWLIVSCRTPISPAGCSAVRRRRCGRCSLRPIRSTSSFTLGLRTTAWR